MLDSNEKLLTIKEVMAQAKVSRYTIYRDIKAGYLPAIHLGRNVRILESEAKRYADKKGNSIFVTSYKERMSKNEVR